MLVLEDANQIIQADKVFSYELPSSDGHAKGSFAGFSDIFRYKLLFERGGWWTDMDITLLKPLDDTQPYYFRKHNVLAAVGNLMKCPPHSDLMLYCFERAVKEVDSQNTDWLKPIRILNDGIKKFELEGFVVGKQSNHDFWNDVVGFTYLGKEIPVQWKYIHWMNELWRGKGIDKWQIQKGSTLGGLYERFGVGDKAKWQPYSHFTAFYRSFTMALQFWYQKGKGWLKKPGIPVFLTKSFDNSE